MLAALGGALATGCTSQEKASTVAAGPSAAAPVTAVRTPGTRADSLGGIPGHKFNEPLSAFLGLKVYPSQLPGSRTYYYPGGKGEPGWFGKRKKESPDEFYTYYLFKDGRSVAFKAMALGTGRKALQEQTRYLLGTGTQTTTTMNWEGKQVLAYYALINQPYRGLAEVLDVQSQEFVKKQATAKNDQLKKDNAL